jgi:hypothetical protein
MRYVSSPLLLILPLLLTTTACSEPKVASYLIVDAGEHEIFPSLTTEITPDKKQEYLDTQITLIESPFVIKNALSRHEIAELDVVLGQADPEAWLSRSLSATNPKGTWLLFVTLRSEGDVGDLKKVLDGVVEAYLNEVVAVSRVRSQEKKRDIKVSAMQQQEVLKELLERRNAVRGELKESNPGSSELEMLEIEIGVRQKVVEEIIREEVVQDLLDGLGGWQVNVLQPAMESP